MSEILSNFLCFQLLLKPSQICDALSTKTSFYLWGDFMSTFMVCIDLLYVTTNFLMNVCTCLIEIK